MVKNNATNLHGVEMFVWKMFQCNNAFASPGK